jgi:hypothetical protein
MPAETSVSTSVTLIAHPGTGGSFPIYRDKSGTWEMRHTDQGAVMPHWRLYKHGTHVDSDRYRYDLAERHDLKLRG